jgi:hypothetical protein
VALAALPEGVVLTPPIAPQAAGSQWALMAQRAHRHPLLVGHAPWVDRVRPAAWDAAVAEDPAAIFARFRAFSERVQATLPQTRIIFVSSTRSPDRVARWEQVDHYNALARAYCATTPLRLFVDVNPALVDAAGHPRLDLYKEDKLHFHPPAYVEFTRVIRPVLERVWADVSRRVE